MEELKPQNKNREGEVNEPMPLVFWDGYGLSGGYSGILTHALEIASGMGALGLKPIIVGDKGLKIHFPNHDVYVLEGLASTFRLNRLKLAWPFAVERIIREKAQQRKHIVHGLSNFNIPLTSVKWNQRRVLTIHDMIPFLDPSSVSMAYGLQFKAALIRALDVVDQVICVSNWTLQCLLSFFPRLDGRCKVIYNGVNTGEGDLGFKELSGSIEVLSIARFEKYKRIDMILEIARKLPKSYSLNLITDQKGRDFCERYGEELLRSHKIFVYVGLPNLKVKELYRKSHIYIHPSLYEGFNIPAVDAVVHGLPVVFCKGIGTEEIIGPDLGVSIEPQKTADTWVDAIVSCREILENESWRLKAKYALEKLPSWSSNAAQTINIYRELY